MPLRITNSLTRRKEDFVPLDPAGKRVLFYNCGPTVYGAFHIGNARNFVVVDVMRRWLDASGYDVHFVQNITDVDDKIIDQAAKEGMTPDALAEKYTALFFEHLELLGVRRADEHPRATQFIQPMLGLVETLIERGHAYPSEDGSVWFDVRSFASYGKLSRKNLDDMREGERVREDQQRLKRSPLDFALWKAAKPGEPAWKSPWGEGRPGWHLECSCMAMQCLGAPTIDIHSGGIDLQFPHHENEIAQSEAATGKPFVRTWIHNGFLNIDGEKMSKSLGNFKRIDALLEKFDALTLRHFLISAHYRTELDFTQENLDAAAKVSRRYALAAAEARRVLGGEAPVDAWQSHDRAKALHAQFADAMNDDFNTAVAIAVLLEVVTALNTARVAMEGGGDTRGDVAAFASLLAWTRGVLGLTENLEPKAEAMSDLTQQLMELLIETRAEARKAKQFALSDLIRDRLKAIGIVLEDRPGGTTWKRE